MRQEGVAAKKKAGPAPQARAGQEEGRGGQEEGRPVQEEGRAGQEVCAGQEDGRPGQEGRAGQEGCSGQEGGRVVKAIGRRLLVGPGQVRSGPGRRRPSHPPKPTRGPFASEPKFLEEQRKFLLEEREVYKHQADRPAGRGRVAGPRARAGRRAVRRGVGRGRDRGGGPRDATSRCRPRPWPPSTRSTWPWHAIETKMYGACENCGQPIPKARLRALPYARLCVSCKSGGLHRR